jgi:hypothetical protein
MGDDLREVRDRLAVCRAEIAELKDKIVNYILSAFEIRSQPTSDNRETHIQCRRIRPIPMAITSKVGMIANETRAALDDLAGVLAERNGNQRADTKFPVSATDEAFRTRGVKMIKRLSEPDQAKISELQPCKDKRPLLFALHRLDISRKHGSVVAHSDVLNGFQLTPRESNGMYVEYFRRVEPPPTLDEQWRTVAKLRTASKLRLNPIYHLSLEGQPLISGQEVITTLDLFVSEVEDIVQLFDTAI